MTDEETSKLRFPSAFVVMADGTDSPAVVGQDSCESSQDSSDPGCENALLRINIEKLMEQVASLEKKVSSMEETITSLKEQNKKVVVDRNKYQTAYQKVKAELSRLAVPGGALAVVKTVNVSQPRMDTSDAEESEAEVMSVCRPPSQVGSETGSNDEAEGFQSPKQKKRKRVVVKSPEAFPPLPQAAGKSKFVLKPSATTFSGNSSNNNDTKVQSSQPSVSSAALPKAVKIPPIILREKRFFKELVYIFKANSISFGQPQNRAQGVSFFPKTSDDYRAIVKILDERKYPYHSFCPPEQRLLRVLFRGVLDQFTVEEIKDELVLMGFNPRHIKRWTDKSGNPIPLVQIGVPREERKIFDVEFFLDHRVKVQALKGNGQVVQCFNCQLFGHSATHCKAPPKCVKCAGDHESRACTKDKKSPAKCSNCAKSHTANFSRCECRPLPKAMSKSKTSVTPAPGPKVSSWANNGGRRLASQMAGEDTARPSNFSSIKELIAHEMAAFRAGLNDQIIETIQGLFQGR